MDVGMFKVYLGNCFFNGYGFFLLFGSKFFDGNSKCVINIYLLGLSKMFSRIN